MQSVERAKERILDPATIAKLANHPDPAIRRLIARRKDIDAITKIRLSLDRDPSVQYEAAMQQTSV